METLSHTFIESLALSRDHLYAVALARGGLPSAAEAALLQATRAAFIQVVANGRLNISVLVERGLADVQGTPGGGAAPGDAPVAVEQAQHMMPADVWARLAAAVQLEAARSAKSGMLADDSVLLKPDPILAPRRKVHKSDDHGGGSGVPAMTFILVALAVGVGLTIFILTRPAGGGSPPAPAKPAESLPATGPTHP